MASFESPILKKDSLSFPRFCSDSFCFPRISKMSAETNPKYLRTPNARRRVKYTRKNLLQIRSLITQRISRIVFTFPIPQPRSSLCLNSIGTEPIENYKGQNAYGHRRPCSDPTEISWPISRKSARRFTVKLLGNMHLTHSSPGEGKTGISKQELPG